MIIDSKEIGRRIKELRKARSLKQDDLSLVLKDRKTGVPLSRGQISNLETGKRNFNIYQLKALADYFNVSLETLGVKSDEIELQDVLARTRVIFQDNQVSMEDKQELYEEVMKLYLEAKEQIKKWSRFDFIGMCCFYLVLIVLFLLGYRNKLHCL